MSNMKVMANLKVFQKYVKLQGHKVKHFGTMGKVLSKGIHMWTRVSVETGAILVFMNNLFKS